MSACLADCSTKIQVEKFPTFSCERKVTTPKKNNRNKKAIWNQLFSDFKSIVPWPFDNFDHKFQRHLGFHTQQAEHHWQTFLRKSWFLQGVVWVQVLQPFAYWKISHCWISKKTSIISRIDSTTSYFSFCAMLQSVGCCKGKHVAVWNEKGEFV